MKKFEVGLDDVQETLYRQLINELGMKPEMALATLLLGDANFLEIPVN